MFIGKPRVKIDEGKCILCGICSEVCPSGAIKVDGAKIRLKKLFFADFECEDCNVCVEACPWGAIVDKAGNVNETGDDGRESKAEDDTEKSEESKATKEWIEDLCIFCGRCAKLCPDDKIFVEKPISGEVIIGEGCKFCGVCMDICPSHAISFDGRKMIVDVDVCILCGACRNACPTKVIEIRRDDVRVESAFYPWFFQHERALKSVTCTAVCPVNNTVTMRIESGKLKSGFLCEGCGLCVKVCPFNALELVVEEVEEKVEEKKEVEEKAVEKLEEVKAEKPAEKEKEKVEKREVKKEIKRFPDYVSEWFSTGLLRRMFEAGGAFPPVQKMY